jgi:hypothetical protein
LVVVVASSFLLHSSSVSSSSYAQVKFAPRKSDPARSSTGDSHEAFSESYASSEPYADANRGESFEVALSLRHWTGRSYSEVLAQHSEENLLAIDRRASDRDGGLGSNTDIRKTSSSDLVAFATPNERERSVFHRRLPSEDRITASTGRVPLLRDGEKGHTSRGV